MLIIALILMTITMIYTYKRKRDVLSLYMLLISFSFFIMFLGVITTIAKIGGFSQESITFLFLDKRIQTFLQYRPITLTSIGYMVAVGRTLFPYLLLLIAIECSMLSWVRRNKLIIKILAFIVPAIFLIYYFPPVFKKLVTGRFNLLVFQIYAARVYIIVYIILSFILFFIEYFSITMKDCAEDFRKIILGMIGITILYIIYGIQDPAQIYNMFISEYVSLNSLTYINKAITRYGFLAVFIFIIFFSIIGPMGIIGYTQLGYREEKADRILKNKFDNRSLGISVFAHYMKNQVIAARILDKRLKRSLNELNITDEKIINTVNQSSDLHDDMLESINLLYHRINDRGVKLYPTTIDEVIEEVKRRYNSQIKKGDLEIFINHHPNILADVNRLADGIFQIIRNAFEADADLVVLTVSNERLYNVIHIKDNGKGMEKKELKKIFEPFNTKKSTSTNWGLGLYFTRNIIRNHYGRMKVKSKPGEGTEFIIMLPKFTDNRKEKK